MKAPIIARYEELARAREASRHRFGEHPRAPADGAAQVAAQIAELLERSAFFKRHDYSWAADAASYRNPMEAVLQLIVLTAIQDIPPGHPHFNRAGNICVRIAPSGGVNGLSFQDGDFKYAVLTTSILKYMWEFLHAFDELYPHPPNYKLPHGPDGFGANWEDADALAVARDKALAIDRLVAIADRYADFGIPDLHSRYEAQTEFGDRDLYFGGVITAADAFVILHEVGHLLGHADAPGERSLRQEIEADEAAMSLSIILSAHNDLLLGHMFSGPALAFQAMRHFNLCRRTRRHLDSLAAEDAGFSEEDELQWEKELAQRAGIFSSSAARMGLPKFLTQRFDVLCQQFFFVTECTKHWLIAQIQPPPAR